MKTKVAFLRGPNLNDAELVSYLPLLEDYEFSFYCNARSPLPIHTPQVSPRTLWYADDIVRSLPRHLQPAAELLGQKFFGNLQTPLSIAEICQTHQILHTAETSNGYTHKALALKERYPHKVVVTVWENNPFQHENNLTRPIGQKIGAGKLLVRKYADYFLVPAEASRTALELEGVPLERIACIGAAVDLERFQPRPKSGTVHRQLGISPQARVIVFAGRLVWEKGVFDLLEAFALLNRTADPLEDVHLLYFGSGRERQNLEHERDLLSLRGHVHFMSGQAYANSDQMPALFNDVDVLVLPSLPTRYWQEQFGMVLIEAMASGVPVIGSTSGAIPEVIGDGGVTFPAHDIRALAHHLNELLRLPAYHRELATRGRQHVERAYSPQAVSARIRRVYEKVHG
ncbi:MAG: glycosyltransferase family 4 protein [Gemmatimonadaceae bacterium]|nr:glycosyltransferase family 4 protein [Gloeobacterales cyanobacterium ES-bin-141]